jgi:iron(III) transport system permease protein
VNKRPRLEGKKRWFVFAYAFMVLSLAFIIPVIQLGTWAWQVFEEDLDSRYFMLAEHTLMLGGGTALLAVMAAFILGFTKRYYPSPASRVSVSMGTLGYALPGSVLAVGVMLSFTWIDDWIERVAGWFNLTPELFLTGSLMGLVLAYVVRFMAVSFGPVDSALERIKPSIREAARSLGASRTRIVWQIYLPLLRPGLLTGFLLVFVDVMKEMPATLLLRPFGWDTFAVRIFEMTSEGEWERASLPALSLVIIGLIPVLLLVRSIRQHKTR